MVKNNVFFSLSLIALLATSFAVRAQDDQVPCDCQDEQQEVLNQALEQATSLSMTIEVDKQDPESWAALAETTYRMLAMLTSEDESSASEDCKEELKAYVKHLYSIATRVSFNKNVDSTTNPTTVELPFSLDGIVNSNRIKVVCTVSRAENVVDAWQAIVIDGLTLAQQSSQDATSVEGFSTYLDNLCALVSSSDDIHGSIFVAIE